MSRDSMSFPATYNDFLEEFSFRDKKQVYTNGSNLIPVFRVMQMVDHYFNDTKKTPNEIRLSCGLPIINNGCSIGIDLSTGVDMSHIPTQEEIEDMFMTPSVTDLCSETLTATNIVAGQITTKEE